MINKLGTKTQYIPTLEELSAEKVYIVVNSVKNVELINGGYYGASANLNVSIFNKATGEPMMEDVDLDDSYNIYPVTDDSLWDHYFEDQDEWLYENDDEYKAAWDKYNEEDCDDNDKLAWEWIYNNLDDYYNDVFLDACYDCEPDEYCFLSDDTEEEIFNDLFIGDHLIYDNEHIIDVDDADDDVFNTNTEEKCYHYVDEERNIDIYFDRDYNLLIGVKPEKIDSSFEDMYGTYNEAIYA